MAIDKVFPRRLNSSKDTRLHQQDEMLDAVNVTIDDNNGEFSSGVETATGNFGVLKPVKGNSAVTNLTDHGLATGSKVIGSCNDERAGRIYYFVYSPNGSQSGVYFYDTSGNNLQKLLSSELFNFRGNSYVDGNVVYIPNSVVGGTDLKPILFFTDNHTEPKKIDVQRASEAGSGLQFLDFVSVCPRTPVDPPQWSFQNDPTYKVSNFKGERGFQFAYQNVYKSGDVSALSTYSTLAVPSAYLNQGAQPNPNFFSENYIQLNIPDNAFTSEVSRVRILVRSGNTGAWLIADEVDYSGGSVSSKFYNDEIYTALPVGETRRHFDAVPKKARTQDITNNRLFYANYVEGFDVPDVDATINHGFAERPTDFISLQLEVIPEIRQVNDSTDDTSPHNRVSAYKLDTSGLPDSIAAGTQVIFNLNVSPDNNFHFYESRNSYHGSAQLTKLGDGTEGHIAQSVEHQGLFIDMGNETVGMAAGGASFFPSLQGGGIDLPSVAEQTSGLKRRSIAEIPYRTANSIDEAMPRWAPAFTNEGEIDVTYGTSAHNPFIIQGRPLEFGASFSTLLDISRERLSLIIRDLLTGNYLRGDSSLFDSQVVNGNPVSIPLIDTISVNNVAQYDIDLNISNKDKLNVFGSPDYRTKLINAVGDYSAIEAADSRGVQPCGFFIVNKATPSFTLRDISDQYALSEYGNQDNSFFALDLVDIQNPEIFTCIPDVDMSEGVGDRISNWADVFLTNAQGGELDLQFGNIFDGWVCLTPDFIQFELGDLSAPELGATGAGGMFTHLGSQAAFIVSGLDPLIDSVELNGIYGTLEDEIDVTQIKRWFGGLIPAGTTRTQVERLDGVFSFAYSGEQALIHTFSRFAADAQEFDDIEIIQREDAFFQFAFSTLDGEAGASGKDSGELAGVNYKGLDFGSVTHKCIVMGYAPFIGSFESSVFKDAMGQSSWNMPLLFVPNDQNAVTSIDMWSDSAAADADDPILERESAIVEVTSFDAITVPPNTGSTASRSFKTKATHDFGIVFYDQRGRSTDVVPLGSTYVDGYDNGVAQGPVSIQVNLNSSPPSWAWHYQIVYGGNSTVDDFIQYTAGGAFIEHANEGTNGNIYVSLNYLQENRDVSYAESFGAVSTIGTKDLYNYKEGDKLRIISYYSNQSNRVYPTAYEFDVVGLVNLADDEDNPLINQDNPPAIPSKVGQFLVLRDNPSATGFSFDYVKSAQSGNGTSPSASNAHLWNNRCVFEIYSPINNQDIENRVYYEISRKYNVIRDGGVPSWENNQIVLQNGDVWFRRTALAMPSYNVQQERFLNLIRDVGTSSPKFLDYYVESKTFTDVISGADQYDYGRPKVMNRFQKEIRRDSSVTFSDFNSLSSPVLRYTTFDATTSNFKDLPNKHGQISKIVDFGDSIFVLNEEKVSALPIARSVISDLTGQELIVASEKVIGTQSFYAGDNGCSTNPESVAKVGESLYFANKEKQEVYKFNPANGVQIISEKGMKSYFRELFQSAIDSSLNSGQVRVVGGYDPILDEYVLSVYNAVTLSFSGDVEVLQESGSTVQDDPVNPTNGEGEEEEGGDGVVGPVIDQDVLDALEEQNEILLGQVGSLYDAIVNVINEEGAPSVDELTVELTTFVDNLDSEITGFEDAISSLTGGEVTVNALNEFVGLLEGSLNDNEATITGQLSSASASHEQIRDSLNTSALQMTVAIGQATTNISEDASIAVPLQANHFPNIAPAGANVSKEDFLELMLAYHGQAQANAGLFNEDQGSYSLRSGGAFTDYKIGFGIPTTNSLNDDDPSSDIPIGSAIYENPSFISDMSAFLNAMDLILSTSGAQVTTSLSSTISAVSADKNDILTQISQVVSAIYNTQAANQGGGSVTRLFGINYNGVSESVIESLYNASNEGLTQLEDTLNSYTTDLESLVSANLEDGIQNYKDTQFESLITSQSANIASLEVTRDALLTQAFNGLNATYNLAGKPDVVNQIPAPIAGLLNEIGVDSVPSAATILNAFDENEDGQIDLSEIVFASEIVAEFTADLESVFGAVEPVADALRGPITTFLNATANTVGEFQGFDTSEGSNTDILQGWMTKLESGTDQDVIDVINAFSNVLNESGTGVSVAEGIRNLQSVLSDAKQKFLDFSGLYADDFEGFNEANDFAKGLVFEASNEYPFGANIAGLLSIVDSSENAVARVVQFQRFLGRYEGGETSSTGTYLGEIEFEGLGPDALTPADFFSSYNTTYYQGEPNFPQGFRQTGMSLLVGLHNAISDMRAIVQQPLDSFSGSGFGPEENPSGTIWNFENFQLTNTLEDYVGADIYSIAVEDVEAAFAAANALTGTLNSSLGGTFTVTPSS